MSVGKGKRNPKNTATGGRRPPLRNIANTIAARYENDGQIQVDAAGIQINAALSATPHERYVYGEAEVFEFKDGSAIALTAGGWDTVAWDEESSTFYSVLANGDRNPDGWTFKS